MTTWRKRTGKRKDQFTGPDEFQSFTQKALLYVQENIKKFYIGLAVLAVVIIASALGFMVMKSTQNKAAAQMAEALQYYDVNAAPPGNKPMAPAERLKKASELFGELSSKGGKQADRALYYQANANLEMGDADTAIQEYKTLKDRTDDPLLAALAVQRLASAYQAKGNNREAVDILSADLKSDRKFFKDEDRYRLAKILAEQGDTKQAVNQLEALVKEFPDSPWASEAKFELAKLTGNPVAEQVPAGAPAPANIKVVPAQVPAKK
ncbi:MAG: tetratricopeptide repeat protein [Nitrospirota bacterium]